MKNCIVVITAFLLMGCDRMPENFSVFSSNFSGTYTGKYYVAYPKGEKVYFDSLNAPTLKIGGDINEISLSVKNNLEERLLDVYSDRANSSQRNSKLIKYGKDSKGIKKSLRLVMSRNTSPDEWSIRTSNFILGDYDPAKDTIDIYYTRNFIE